MSDNQPPSDASNSGDASNEPTWGQPDPSQPSYGQTPDYGQAPAYGSAQEAYAGAGGVQQHARGTLILVLGILSIPCCGLFTGIPAVIMGRNALQEIDSSGAQYSNRGLINAGYICGIIGTVLSIVGLILRLTVFKS